MRLKRLKTWLGLDSPADAHPARTLADDLRDAGTTWQEWFNRKASTPRVYGPPDQRHVETIAATCPAIAASSVDAARRILRHQFDLLGSGPYTPIDSARPAAGGYTPIDWTLDPVTGLKFPSGFRHAAWDFTTMRPGNADVKLPWELGRCQHWPVLAQAYRLTNDQRFAAEIADECRDFLDANPVGIGVQWVSTMDVAIRAANWALAFETAGADPDAARQFGERAYEALFAHGVFIRAHLENTYEVTSNHFLSNIVGLWCVAAVFHDLPTAREWEMQCRAWVLQEMAVQVLPDGADYESSVPYHRLVTELFLAAARLAEWRGAPFDQGFLHRVRSMVEFLEAVLRPDGLMPQVGDADDGRFHVLTGYGSWQPQDPRHLFGPAGAMFRSARWRTLGGDAGRWEAAWWGLDADAIEGDGEVVSAPTARVFPDAGLGICRAADHYLLITNGRVGTNGFGNHKHNDLLAFEYHVRGVPVFVDAGSFAYTGDPIARNAFRSTRIHNTVCVDDEEQNEIRPQREWLFRVFEKANPDGWQAGDRAFEYVGRHTGYGRLPNPAVHTRRFRFDPETGGLTISDTISAATPHRLRFHFHCAPGVEVGPLDDGAIALTTARGVLRLSAPATLRVSVGTGWYSPSYGVRVPCATLDFDTDAGAGDFQFQIEP